MIILAVLMLAVAALVAGFLLDQIALTWAALGLAVLAGLKLAEPFLRRKVSTWRAGRGPVEEEALADNHDAPSSTAGEEDGAPAEAPAAAPKRSKLSRSTKAGAQRSKKANSPPKTPSVAAFEQSAGRRAQEDSAPTTPEPAAADTEATETRPEREVPGDADVAETAGGERSSSQEPVATDDETAWPRSAVNGSRAASFVGAAATLASEDASPVVHVVPGRRRYHRERCELIASHESEAVTLDEAIEEGFSACTRCTPEATAAPPT